MKVFAVCCQKGGTGKTTTAHNIAAGFARDGLKTLLVDLDPQTNSTFIARFGNSGATALDLFTGIVKPADCVVNTPRENLFGIRSTPRLSTADLEFKKSRREYLLRDALRKLEKEFDAVVIDTPPSIGVLTTGALVSADFVVIPVQADIASIEALTQLSLNLREIKRGFNPGLKVAGVLLCRYNARARLSKDLAKLIDNKTQEMETRLFACPIREAIAIREADAMRTDIYSYSPRSAVAKDYAETINELEKLIKG